MYRETYCEINLKNIQNNVEKVVKKYSDFKYYFGVVKADSYGHGALETTDYIIRGGVNYLAVALLEEALELRRKYLNIPILCLGVIEDKDLDIVIQNNITISIVSLKYLKTISLDKLKKIKIHIKINTGMNRLGVSSKEEFNKVYSILKNENIKIEGVYSHIHSSKDTKATLEQFKFFEEIMSEIDLSEIEIIHIQASNALTDYKKPTYVNGCRLGFIMYGFTNDKSLNLQSSFKLYSKVIQINSLKKGDSVGYNALYRASCDEKIAVVSIGYADGIIRKNTNGVVYINNKAYKIVGNICMDMLFVKVDDEVKLFDNVEIIKDIIHIKKMAKQLETLPYEILCSISKRVPKIYIYL